MAVCQHDGIVTCETVRIKTLIHGYNFARWHGYMLACFHAARVLSAPLRLGPEKAAILRGFQLQL